MGQIPYDKGYGILQTPIDNEKRENYSSKQDVSSNSQMKIRMSGGYWIWYQSVGIILK